MLRAMFFFVPTFLARLVDLAFASFVLLGWVLGGRVGGCNPMLSLIPYHVSCDLQENMLLSGLPLIRCVLSLPAHLTREHDSRNPRP